MVFERFYKDCDPIEKGRDLKEHTRLRNLSFDHWNGYFGFMEDDT
jgi:hypothetical protein